MPCDEEAPPPAGRAAAAPGPPGVAWRKARRSGAENGGCVEIGGAPGIALIRDSCRPGNGAHSVPAAAFAAFLAGVKAGSYDLRQAPGPPVTGGAHAS